MSELISGKEALIALANGEDVQLRNLKIVGTKSGQIIILSSLKLGLDFLLKGSLVGTSSALNLAPSQ